MKPPFERVEEGSPAVHGYGDVNADFHLVGDFPGRHGGADSGVPLADRPALLEVFREVGLLAGQPPDLQPQNLFLSYRHMCRLPPGETPTEADYATCEPHLDAAVRAVNAHVMFPVGERTVEHVLETYTTSAPPTSVPHAEAIHGRGFLVVPIRDPPRWDAKDKEQLTEQLASLRDSDYRQTKGRSER